MDAKETFRCWLVVSVRLARRRKAQRSTGSTTVQDGTKSDGRFQRFSESWSKKQDLKRRSGSGKEVVLNILSVEVNGTGSHFSMRKWES